MALINCPSCGKPVSDKAEKCVHCGITLAPTSDSPAEANAATTEDKQIDYMQQFHSDEPDPKRKKDKLNNLFKIYDKYSWFFIALFIGLFALAAYLATTVDFFKTYGGGALALFCVFGAEAVGIVLKFTKGEILPYLYSVTCSKWIVKNNIDAAQYIKDKYIMYATNADADGITDDLFYFAQGVVFAKDAKGYAKTKAHFIIRSAVVITLALWVAIAVPFVGPLALLALRASSTDIALLLVVAVPIIVLFVLRIILFYALAIPDRKRVSSQYASN